MDRSEHDEVRTFFLALESLFRGMDRLPDEIACPQTFPGLLGRQAVRSKVHARRPDGEDEVHAVIDQTRNAEGTRQPANRVHEPEKLPRAKVSFPNLDHHPPFGDDVPKDLQRSVLSDQVPVSDNV